MEKKLLSIIVPVYNKEKYVRECIESIIAQDYTNIEILLVDDGSTDKSGEICDEYAQMDRRVRVFHQENSGPNPAREKGVKNAEGEYIGFVDADDYIEPNMYSRLIEVLEEEDADEVRCGYIQINEAGNEIGRSFYDISEMQGENCIIESERTFVFALWSSAYKKSLFTNINFANFCMGEDIIVSLQLRAKCKKVILLNEYYYNVVLVNGSLSRSISSKKALVDLLATEWHYNFLTKNYHEINITAILFRICMLALYGITQLKINKIYDRSECIKILHEKFKFYYKELKTFDMTKNSSGSRILLVMKLYNISPFLAISIYRFVLWLNRIKKGK